MKSSTQALDRLWGDFLGSLDIEARSLVEARDYLKKNSKREVLEALKLILNHSGKLITTGMGKSGIVARKAASTFTSTGTPCVFLHPSEALHGDLGLVSARDVVIVFGKSGESSEVTHFMEALKKVGCKTIAITSRESSRLAKASHVVLPVKISREACTHDLAPTSSTTASMALADALAVAAMNARKFSAASFAALHPGGALGFRLNSRVEDLMISLRKHPPLNPRKSSIEDVVEHLGLIGLVVFSEKNGELFGILTDGDVRRSLSVFRERIFDQNLLELINRDPLFVDAEMSAQDALQFMEARERPLNAVPVLKNKKVIGVLRLHDLLKGS